jgi:4'-phosphopantetheinyl transferase EntD
LLATAVSALTSLSERASSPLGIGAAVEADWRRALGMEDLRLLDAATSRQRAVEFACGRHAGHRALASMGIAAPVIGRGGRGEPLWPEGVVGAISHAAGIALAIVSRSPPLVGVGIDVEDRAWSLSDRALHRAATRGELELGARCGISGIALLSLKESAFKAMSPQPSGARFVDVTLEPGECPSSVLATLPGVAERVYTGWTITDSLVISLAWRTIDEQRLQR